MYFGWLLLGTHLEVIPRHAAAGCRAPAAHRGHRAYLQETTAPETRRVADQTPEPQMKALIATLVQAFHQAPFSGQ